MAIVFPKPTLSFSPLPSIHSPNKTNKPKRSPKTPPFFSPKSSLSLPPSNNPPKIHPPSLPNDATLPDSLSTLLQAIAATRSLDAARSLHHLAASSEQLISNPILTTKLLTMYSLCGSPSDSRRVFDELESKNLFQWNAMISGYSRNELWSDAIAVFVELVSTTEFKPDNFTLPCVLKSCAGISDVGFGRTVHGVGVKMGLSNSDTYVGNSLISMYAKCGCVDEAVRVFDKMPSRNLVSWNTIISGFSENGLVDDGFDLFGEMMMLLGDEDWMRPDDATVVTLLPMCASEGWVEMGRLVHGLSVKLGLDGELRVNNALIDMYAKCGCLAEAKRLFKMPLQRNVVSWNAMIGGCARNDDIKGTFDLLKEMVVVEGMKANEVTVLNVFPACLGPSELERVKELHGYVIRNALEGNELVVNALIAAYAKCGSLKSAERVFDCMEADTVSSWNALIGGCAQNGDPRKAIDLFLKMAPLGLEPDWFSIGSLLLACAQLKYLRFGRSIHGFIQRNGMEKDSFISISLLSLYVQCGESSKARALFDAMEEKNTVSWNAMIAGYSQNGLSDESLNVFRQMQRDGFEPSMITTTSAFMACAQLSALRFGKEIHSFALKAHFTKDAFVACSIIDMYAKCGSIEHSRNFFDRLNDRDTVSWTVMITGYGIHGHATEAIELLNKMESEGLMPDAFTYIGILMACSHAGLVEEGLKYFDEMRHKHAVEPKLEHYACVADMLGRAGRLADAMKHIEDMPEEPDGAIWSALLGACRIHGDIDMGEKVAEKLLELEPDKAEHYVLASNLFAGSGRWDAVRRIRKSLKEKGLQKDPGCSWVELAGKVYNFMVGDNLLPESEEIRKAWRVLEEKIGKIGYIPDTGSVLHDVEEEEKVELLRGHSEKQAIVFGLMNTTKGTTVRVCKNIRMCRDCHNAVKLVSEVEKRQIIVRDNKRFHHFQDGSCSCGDYW